MLQKILIATTLAISAVLIGRACKNEKPSMVIQRTVSKPAPAASSPQTPAVIEQTYTCGARTKKGSPCSRRVHGPVRCWQHKGATAMLPQEKLIVKE